MIGYRLDFHPDPVPGGVKLPAADFRRDLPVVKPQDPAGREHPSLPVKKIKEFAEIIDEKIRPVRPFDPHFSDFAVLHIPGLHEQIIEGQSGMAKKRFPGAAEKIHTQIGRMIEQSVVHGR